MREQGDVIFHHLESSQLADVQALYARLNQGRRLGRERRWLLRLLGDRLCLVASERSTEQIVGVVLFYFNPRDCQEGTVHEGFIGVQPERQRQGIGSSLRRHALIHFAACGLEGVSSRVSLANEASLKSALRLGFRPVEKYFDPTMGEERYYLVCRFDEKTYSVKLADMKRDSGSNGIS